jgi:hypothetical protein
VFESCAAHGGDGSVETVGAPKCWLPLGGPGYFTDPILTRDCGKAIKEAKNEKDIRVWRP